MRRAALAGALLLGLLLRLLRGPARWDEITLAYAAYLEPVHRALDAGELGQAVATWVGLHPPLHAALLYGVDRIWPAPALWIGLSLAASYGAVRALGRVGGAVAALALATSPLQLAYAAEVNNYPLAVFSLALVLALAEGPPLALGAAVALAGWSHVLAGLGGLGVLAWRARGLGRREAGAALGAALLGLLPVGAGALRRILWGSSWEQGGLDGSGALGWAEEAARRVGPEGVALGLVALIGLRGAALAATAPLALALLVAVAGGAAAAHQFPYLLLFGPPLALGLARAVELPWAGRPWVGRLVVALCLLRGARAGADEIAALQALARDQATTRGVDLAWRESRPGDRIWLVAPALLPDDDKSDLSPTLWRLSPWTAWSREALPGFEYTDPRAGAPRRTQGRVVHASTTLDLQSFDAAAAATFETGGRIWVVLYDHAPAEGLVDDLRLTLRPYVFEERSVPVEGELGPDLLWRVEGRR